MKRLLKISAILSVLFVAGGFATCSYTVNKANKLYQVSKNKTFDVIIVPGVPFEDGKWSSVMQSRVYWSKFLYETGVAKNIIYSGSAVYSPYYEAEIMALYAIELGIPKENIFTETKAEHSTENVYYCYKKARNLGFKTIALATDPFQAKLVQSFMEDELNNDITIIPIIYDSLHALTPPMGNPTIDYSMAYDSSFVSIMEREGFWKRLRGTRGKNINESYYE